MKEECQRVLDHVWSFLDGETDPREADAIRDHLEGCEPCLSEFDFQEALKSLVRRSCRESAPATLRARIVTQITTSTSLGAGGVVHLRTEVTDVQVGAGERSSGRTSSSEG